jgi:hypothetical protein
MRQALSRLWAWWKGTPVVEETKRERMARIRAARKAAGLCVCGKRRIAPRSKSRCEECLRLQLQRQHARKRSHEAITAAIVEEPDLQPAPPCTQCGRPRPTYFGTHPLCLSCLEGPQVEQARQETVRRFKQTLRTKEPFLTTSPTGTLRGTRYHQWPPVEEKPQGKTRSQKP